MRSKVKRVDAEELIEAARQDDSSTGFRVLRTLQPAIDHLIVRTTMTRVFRLLYTSRWERVLKYWTIVSILAVSAALAAQTWFPHTHGQMNTYTIDWIVLSLIFGETILRTIRLEFLPSFASVIVRSYGNMSIHDIRRFRLLKLVLYRIDVGVLIILFFYLIDVLHVDPLYVAVARLLRLVAILRAFDIPLMKDLTAVILSAFESMGLVFIALGMHVFVYAVVGTVMFGSSQPTYFGDLPSSVNTLLFPLVNKGESPAMVALCKECGGNSVGQILYFSSFLWIGGVILLGLLTSIAKEKVDQFRKRGS
jgi:hypothetical protein